MVALATIILSAQPSVQEPEQLDHTEISNIKKQFSESNPFKRKRYGLKHVAFDEKTLNQAVRLAMNKVITVPTYVELKNGLAHVRLSSKLPTGLFDLYLNIAFDLKPTEQFFEVDNLKVGDLKVPDWIVTSAAPYVMRSVSDRYPDYIELISAIRKIDIKPQYVAITYRWNNVVANRAQSITRDVLLSPREQELVSVYYTHLSDIFRLTFWRKTSLDNVIRPMFALAKERTQQGGDAIEENRAVLLTLGLVATAVPIRHLIKFDPLKRVRNVRFYHLTLHNRRDLMQHFLISAALTVSTNKTLTDAIGLSKEMEDSEGGSGFSFADLLADRAGVRFAGTAVSDTDSAITLQNYMSREDLKETDYMPSHKNLPEAISALEFKKTYVDVKNEKYQFVENELIQRILSTPLHNI